MCMCLVMVDPMLVPQGKRVMRWAAEKDRGPLPLKKAAFLAFRSWRLILVGVHAFQTPRIRCTRLHLRLEHLDLPFEGLIRGGHCNTDDCPIALCFTHWPPSASPSRRACG